MPFPQMHSTRPHGARRATLLGSLLAVLALVLSFSASGEAATPAQGTVSDTSRTVSWSGGPFAAPNASAAAGDPDCTAPQSCDDYTLHVTTPAGYDSTHTLTVKVGWTNTAADFDVYVLQGGKVVGTSASSANPETVQLPAAAGDYTVRVVPYLPLGSSYDATATITDKPTDPAPGTATPPGFTTYAAPASLPDADNAGEPSIGSSYQTGSSFYQAYLSTYKVRFDDHASPATATWNDVSAKAANGCPGGSTKSLDPILTTDHRTGRTFESQLTGANSLTCYTDDDGASWHPSTGGGIPSGVDHQTLGGGPYSSSGIGALPTSSYPDSVYYCSQDIATAFCAASHDGGTTFGNGVPTYSLLDCGGLHGHVKVAPDGTAYLPNKGCGENAAVVTSTDNGGSWTVHKVPGSSPSDADPSVATGAGGTLYFGYVGADGRPAVAVSRDKGSSFTTPIPVGTEFGIKNAVFPAMVAGDDDRASLAFIGTPTGGNYQDAATFKGVWHLYVATTYDGGKTWNTSDATPNDPVQRGSICTGGTTCGNDRNLLDFIDATVDPTGHIEVGFADGCIKTCVTDPSETSGAGPADAQAAYATIARSSSGLGLYASGHAPATTTTSGSGSGGSGGTTGKVTNLSLQQLRVTRRPHHRRFTTSLSVVNTGTETVRGIDVVVRDRGRVVFRRTGLSLAPGQTTSLSYTRHEARGRHRIVATVDPAQRIPESNESDNTAVRQLR